MSDKIINNSHLDGIELLCYFDGICRVGHWNESLSVWMIHADGILKCLREIDEYKFIPKRIIK